MKTEYIILILLLAIVLLVAVNKKKENAIFCKLPGIKLIPDASGNYSPSYCCSGKITGDHKCTCLEKGAKLSDYVDVTPESCCSTKTDASGNCM